MPMSRNPTFIDPGIHERKTVREGLLSRLLLQVVPHTSRRRLRVFDPAPKLHVDVLPIHVHCLDDVMNRLRSQILDAQDVVVNPIEIGTIRLRISDGAIQCCNPIARPPSLGTDAYLVTERCRHSTVRFGQNRLKSAVRRRDACDVVAASSPLPTANTENRQRASGEAS
jgi:hypothetical protein